MMKINGFNGRNMQAGIMGMAQANDSVSRNIQNQIANAQQKLKDLSSKEEMSFEDKMKKRQEIQQEITKLHQQLRQHQMEQQKEQRKEQQGKKSSVDDLVGGTKNASVRKGTGLSRANMQAMISADSSMKQARVQGNMATQMKGQAGVLAAEIKQDAGRGNTEKKEAELAKLQTRVQAATQAQISTLADANRVMEEAAKEDNKTEAAETKREKADKSEKAQKNKGIDKSEEAPKMDETGMQPVY